MNGVRDLNYHHLRLFWAVAREGSLTKAAQRLHLTLPTVSAQIRQLEEALGSDLLRRTGRQVSLTESGKRALELADDIFQLGEELVRRVHRPQETRQLRVNIGITDSLPKLLSWEIIRPVFRMETPVQVTCREAPAEDLLTALAAGRLDVVVADEPAPGSLPLRVFSHQLGECGTTFCAVPAMAKRLRGGFPGSLHGAPMLLPMAHTAWRHAVDAWLHRRGLAPRVLAEFDDAALMKVAAADGLGAIPVPARIAGDVKTHFGLVEIGTAPECAVRHYAITPQRRISHPAVEAMLTAAGAGHEAARAM